MSTWSMPWIPSTVIFDLLINELNAKDDNICIFDFASSPFKSDLGLLSAYPNFLAFYKTSLKFNFVSDIFERI